MDNDRIQQLIEDGRRATAKHRREAVLNALDLALYDVARAADEGWSTVDRLRSDNEAVRSERDDWKAECLARGASIEKTNAALVEMTQKWQDAETRVQRLMLPPVHADLEAERNR